MSEVNRGARTDEAISQTLIESALAGERVVSIVRIVFVLAVVARSLYYWTATNVTSGHDAAKAWITMPPAAVVIAFSIAVLCGLGRRRHTTLVLHVSVALDAIVCFISLLPNSLWPAPEYQGVPYMMDTAGLLVLTMAAGLRHSASAATLGALLNAASYVGLAVADHITAASFIPPHLGPYTMYGILVLGAGALALIVAIRTRRVVERAARAAIAADHAGRGLRSMLRDHHDLRSALSSAQLNADMLARTGDRNAEELIVQLREDLGEIRQRLEQVKGRALEELAGLQAAVAVSVDATASEVIAALQPRFPAIDLVAAIDGALSARVAGGDAALRRILANLIVNACEGDGRRGATRVELRGRALGGRAILEVNDNGPGIPAEVLATPAGDAMSTKPAGTGLGIGLVDGLVRASGGTIAWRNQDGGGALVEIALPVAGDR